MSQLMENLFSLLGSPMASEAERRAVEESEEAVRAVEKRLTREEFENLWSAVIDIGDADCLSSFTLGFRLGVQLTLEGLRPII
ncbi:MAG: hypothetical protein HFF70_04875 [Oscillospiraceae bacterium]|jgi:hypothetical protein|nr:hypothetical protein [Oscillospiraceae bacterium]